MENSGYWTRGRIAAAVGLGIVVVLFVAVLAWLFVQMRQSVIVTVPDRSEPLMVMAGDRDAPTPQNIRARALTLRDGEAVHVTCRSGAMPVVQE